MHIMHAHTHTLSFRHIIIYLYIIYIYIYVYIKRKASNENNIFIGKFAKYIITFCFQKVNKLETDFDEKEKKNFFPPQTCDLTPKCFCPHGKHTEREI